MRKALITGINGQDGHFLAELLKRNDFLVYGLVRPRAHGQPGNPFVVSKGMLFGDAGNYGSVFNAIETIRPDHIYHLAAISFIPDAEKDKFGIFDTNVMGTQHILDIAQELVPEAKIFLAGSSEMFGEPYYCPQDEKHDFNPESLYGISKLAGFHIGIRARRRGQFVSNGIMYNHESIHRPANFVTKKIVKAIAGIAAGEGGEITLGNLKARRDWGFAGDYVRAMFLMMEDDEPDDYIIATGKTHTVADILEVCFGYLGVRKYDQYVHIDNSLYRKDTTVALVGSYRKIKESLGWEPTIGFKEMIITMLSYEREKLTKGWSK